MSIEIYLPKKHSENSSSPSQNQSESSPLYSQSDLFIGLHNHGNTCYLNSFLQSMYMTPEFRSSVLKFNYDYNKFGPKKDCIPFQLEKLFARLQLKLRKAEETNDLITSFGWTSTQASEQNDIQELYHVLFDAISYSNEKYINDLFQSILSTNIKCRECGNISSHDELYIDFSLPIKKGKMVINSLESSFENFFEKEELIKDNLYNCEKCNKKVEAEKYFEVKQLPKILLIALNRFEFDYKKGIKKKINTPISIPDKINKIGNFENLNYDLYGIIIHSGSAMSGHYFSLLKNFEKEKKWYKFDDRCVYEINDINEYKKIISGNEKNLNDSTAYILLYRNNSEKNEQNEEYDFSINKDLMEDINLEEVEYQRLLEEEKERMSYLNLRVFYNNKFNYIKIKKFEKLLELKNKFFELYAINKDKDKENLINIENDSRIIIYNSNNNKIIDILNPSKDNMTLEELNLTQNHIYHLEIKQPSETFDEFNPDEINISLIKWDDSYLNEINKNKKRNKSDIEKNSIQIKINKNMPKEEFIKKIKLSLNFSPEENILIHKTQEYGYNNINLITLNSEVDLKKFISDNLLFYIEADLKQNSEEYKFKKYFDSFIPDIKVVFNTPIPEDKLKKIKRITAKDYKFDKSLEINPKTKLIKLKEEISKILNISLDNFIIKKNTHNGIEIKNLEETIDKYSTKNLTLYIQYGTPRKDGDILLNIHQYIYDISIFHIYPYTIIDLGHMIFDKKNNLNEVINIIRTKNKKFLNNNNDKDNSDNIEYYLREEKNLKIGKIFLDKNKTLLDIGIKEGETLICQNIDKNNIFIFEKENINEALNISIRFFDHKNWSLSTIYEIFFNKKITTKDFYINIIKYIIEQKKLQCEDLTEIEGVKISNNEFYFYMDDIINNMTFLSFVEFEETSMYNYPFLLNSNGNLLLIRYNIKDIREPTIEEMNYLFKVNENNINKKEIKKKKNLGNKNNIKYNKIKKEVYKEKAMKINVKKFDGDKGDNND